MPIFSQYSFAYSATPIETHSGIITQISSYDKHARIAVHVSDVRYNEVAKCSTQDAYVLDNRTEGYNSHRALIMAAYMAGKRIEFYVKGCVNDNPRIVSVRI